MEKALFILAIFVLIISCKKEAEEPITGPVVVLNQVEVEENLVGIWKGVITGSNGLTENVDVTVEKMILGEKVAEGIYSASSSSCGFKWTYESFSNGRVTFREKTLNPNICFDNVAVVVRFEDEDFETLHLLIILPSASYSGALTRQ